jgi:hypothetical protein
LNPIGCYTFWRESWRLRHKRNISSFLIFVLAMFVKPVTMRGRKEATMTRHGDQLMLMRIIALLFSLASLSEGLVGSPARRRSLVLRLLRPAERVARELLAREVGGRRLRGLPSPLPLDEDGPQGATRLALCFRGLALALDAILTQFSATAASPVQAEKPPQRKRRRALRPLAFSPATVLDTS